MKGDEPSLVELRGTHDYVLTFIYDDGADTVSLADGVEFILLNDTSFANLDMHSRSETHAGIRPRWALVLSTSKEAEDFGIKPGDKVLLDTMKWSRGFRFDITHRRMHRIPADDILMVDEDGLTPEDFEKVSKWFAEDPDIADVQHESE